MNKCLLCEKEYQPIRSSSLFCTQKCRVNYHHIKNKAKKMGDKIEYLTTSNGIKMKITKEILVNELAKRGVQIPQQIPYQVFSENKTETSKQIEEVKYDRLDNPIKTVKEYISKKMKIKTQEDLYEFMDDVYSDTNLTLKEKKDIENA